MQINDDDDKHGKDIKIKVVALIIVLILYAMLFYVANSIIHIIG